MKQIELDLTGCKHSRDLHERIRTAFDFPAWYGHNWDAFWDLLWSECDADKVLITGEHSLPNELNNALTIMHECLDDKIAFNKKCYFNDFTYEILS